MLPFLLRMSAVLTFMFCLILGMLSVQPFDDGGLRETLFSKDCQPPCFMGIYPGVTTRDQALRLLGDNPLVAHITTPDNRIEWTWNRQQPDFLRVSLEDSRILLRNEIVSWIGIETAVRLGDIKVLFDIPDATYAGTGKEQNQQGVYTYFEESIVYSSYKLEMTVYAHCPLDEELLWQQTVVISVPARHDFIPNFRNRFAPVPRECQ